jgi:hypothetical protein
MCFPGGTAPSGFVLLTNSTVTLAFSRQESNRTCCSDKTGLKCKLPHLKYLSSMSMISLQQLIIKAFQEVATGGNRSSTLITNSGAICRIQ